MCVLPCCGFSCAVRVAGWPTSGLKSGNCFLRAAIRVISVSWLQKRRPSVHGERPARSSLPARGRVGSVVDLDRAVGERDASARATLPLDVFLARVARVVAVVVALEAGVFLNALAVEHERRTLGRAAQEDIPVARRETLRTPEGHVAASILDEVAGRRGCGVAAVDLALPA